MKITEERFDKIRSLILNIFDSYGMDKKETMSFLSTLLVEIITDKENLSYDIFKDMLILNDQDDL